MHNLHNLWSTDLSFPLRGELPPGARGATPKNNARHGHSSGWAPEGIKRRQKRLDVKWEKHLTVADHTEIYKLYKYIMMVNSDL